MSKRLKWTDLAGTKADLKVVSEHATEAFERTVGRCCVGLVFGPQGANLDTASGVAVSWQGHRGIVTAGHVFGPNTDDEVVLILPRDRPFERGNRTEHLPPEDLECVVRIPRPEIIQCDFENTDLCYFAVGDEIGNGTDLEFYELPSFAKTPPSDTACMLSGFPADLSGPISAEESLVRLANRWSTICNDEDKSFLKNFDPAIHFLMDFHVADKGKRAEGFSGGGVWFPLRQPANSPLWHAVRGLAGIQTAWYPRRALTQAVRVEVLVRFLQRTLG